MKKKIFLIVLIIISASKIFFAQQRIEKMAFAGPNGIFINTGMEIPFSASSQKIPFKYKIERSCAGQNNWAEITQLSASDN